MIRNPNSGVSAAFGILVEALREDAAYYSRQVDAFATEASVQLARLVVEGKTSEAHAALDRVSQHQKSLSILASSLDGTMLRPVMELQSKWYEYVGKDEAKDEKPAEEPQEGQQPPFPPTSDTEVPPPETEAQATEEVPAPEQPRKRRRPETRRPQRNVSDTLSGPVYVVIEKMHGNVTKRMIARRLFIDFPTEMQALGLTPHAKSDTLRTLDQLRTRMVKQGHLYSSGRGIWDLTTEGHHHAVQVMNTRREAARYEPRQNA